MKNTKISSNGERIVRQNVLVHINEVTQFEQVFWEDNEVKKVSYKV